MVSLPGRPWKRSSTSSWRLSSTPNRSGVEQWGEAMSPAMLERTGRNDLRRPGGHVHRSRRLRGGRADRAVGEHRCRPDRRSNAASLAPPVSTSDHWTRRRSISGAAKRPAVSARPARRARRGDDRSRPPGGVRYRRGGHRLGSAADACSRAGPVTRSDWVIGGVCGPDAIFAPGAAKPTTPNPGRRRTDPARQRRAGMRTPQPLETTRLPTVRDDQGRWHTYRPTAPNSHPSTHPDDDSSTRCSRRYRSRSRSGCQRGLGRKTTCLGIEYTKDDEVLGGSRVGNRGRSRGADLRSTGQRQPII